MSTGTGIQWTDASWNPTTGCTRVSAGCDNCYAVTMTNRLQAMGQEKYAGLTVLNGRGDRHFNGKVRCVEEALKIPFGWKKPRRIFVNSMSDLFHKEVPFEFIDRVFAVMALCPQHTFQVLTKRPDRMAEYLNRDGASTSYYSAFWKLQEFMTDSAVARLPESLETGDKWPLPNVWLGTSCENQEAADERILHLLKCPAAVRFISAEPLLGPIDLSKWLRGNYENKEQRRRDLSARAIGTFDDRQRRANLAEREAGRASSDELPSGSSDAQSRKDICACTSTGMEAPQRPNSRWSHSQPQERNQDRQPPLQSGISNAIRTDQSCEVRAGEGFTTRSSQQQRQTKRSGDQRNTPSSDIRRAPEINSGRFSDQCQDGIENSPRPALDRLICGGESGKYARPCDISWIRSIVEQCMSAGVPCFVKQVGKYPLDFNASDWPDGTGFSKGGHPRTKCHKGGDPSEWPVDLRVREFPEVSHV